MDGCAAAKDGVSEAQGDGMGQQVATDKALARAVESTVIDYRWQYEGERAESIDTGDALIQALKVPAGTHGFAGRFRLEAAHAAERLDALLAQAEKGGRRFLWITSPSSEPADVSDLLVSRGIPRTIVWDGLVLRDLARPFEHGHGVTAEPLSRRNAADYARMVARDSGEESTYGERLAAALRLVESGQSEAQVFLGRIDGQAAGCAVLRIEPGGIAYLRNAFTVREFRHRGVYLALVTARLASARAAGCTAAVVQAQIQSSSPVLRKRGFEPVCRLYGHMRP